MHKESKFFTFESKFYKLHFSPRNHLKTIHFYVGKFCITNLSTNTTKIALFSSIFRLGNANFKRDLSHENGLDNPHLQWIGNPFRCKEIKIFIFKSKFSKLQPAAQFLFKNHIFFMFRLLITHK